MHKSLLCIGRDFGSLFLIQSFVLHSLAISPMYDLAWYLQGNWNYFAANRNEKRAPKLEATHYEKSKELYTKV